MKEWTIGIFGAEFKLNFNFFSIAALRNSLKWSVIQQIKIGPLVLGSFGKYMKSGRFHDGFHDGFHEIRQISCISVLVLQKNTAKSTIHEIWQISWWNPANFMKSGRFHGEIWQISWNLADFICKLPHLHMKSGGFHDEIWRITSMKSGGFHGWSWKMQTFFITLITFFSM